MSFGMTVDYQALSTDVFADEGCAVVQVPPVGSSPVVNVDANFVVPDGMTDTDFSFPRLTQMRDMISAAEEFGPIPAQKLDLKGPRRPVADHLSEWKQVKKAVSLTANGKGKLASRKVAEGSKELYSDDELAGPTDWFFRFTMKLLGRKYGAKFKGVMSEIREISTNHECDELLKYYSDEMVLERFQRYREIFTDFFSKYSQFSQTFFQAGLGMAPAEGMVATSVQFDQVKSFYGDAYEVFAGSVDLLAFFNNIKHGRKFDAFETMTLVKYQKLDNSSKFNPFGVNAAFTDLCEEKDNQLRNASHHRGMKIDSDGRTIRYRAGKGGTGEEQEMSYADYLFRSVSLFLQICVLAAVELTICSANNIDLPFD